MPGVRLTAGADLQIPAGAIRIRMTDDGETMMDPVTPLLRTDMWPYWLTEAIEAVVRAIEARAEVAPAFAAKDEERIDEALRLELRSSMRAISASAFAVDAFYASVQSRSGPHPDKQKWRENRTSRSVQVFETLRYHLKLKEPGAKEAQSRIQQLFMFRGWAVHPGSRFREPFYRADVDAGVDWHFNAFRADNAVTSVAMTIEMLDAFVQHLRRGGDELAGSHPAARKAMDRLLDAYEKTELPSFQRATAQEAEDNAKAAAEG